MIRLLAGSEDSVCYTPLSSMQETKGGKSMEGMGIIVMRESNENQKKVGWMDCIVSKLPLTE